MRIINSLDSPMGMSQIVNLKDKAVLSNINNDTIEINLGDTILFNNFIKNEIYSGKVTGVGSSAVEVDYVMYQVLNMNFVAVLARDDSPSRDCVVNAIEQADILDFERG